MPRYYIVGKLSDNPRGKRLQRVLAATQGIELPDETGLSLASGQDYQTRTPAEQRKWLAWAARPGCALLLVPPFQTGVRHEPNGWELVRLGSPPVLDQPAHQVLRLTQPEINFSLTRGLAQSLNPLIDGGTKIQLSGIFRKHPDSGIFGVTSVPVWSIALADHVSAVTEWLSAWHALAGCPIEVAKTALPSSFEPSQRHFSVLLYLASGNFPNRAAALAALAWSEIFDFGDADIPSLLEELQTAGWIAEGALTPTGRRNLLESPFRHYAEAYLNPLSTS